MTTTGFLIFVASPLLLGLAGALTILLTGRQDRRPSLEDFGRPIEQLEREKAVTTKSATSTT